MNHTTQPQDADERRERYATPLFTIMRENGWDGERTEQVVHEMDLVLDAVIAVADAELAEARDRYTAGLRHADEMNNALMEEVQRYADGTERPVLWSVYNEMHKRALTAEARAAAMERAMESTAADALAHGGCHRKLMAQCLRAERAEAALARIAQMADAWEQRLPEVIRTPAVVSAIRAALEPAALPSVVVSANRATPLREAATRLWHQTSGLTEYGRGARWAIGELRRLANEAEFAATPCAPVVPCEDGGEPCDVHERMLGHYEDSHELCPPDCGATGGPSRVAAEEQPAETQAPPVPPAAIRRKLRRWAYAAGHIESELDGAVDRMYAAIAQDIADARPAVGERPDTQTPEAGRG